MSALQLTTWAKFSDAEARLLGAISDIESTTDRRRAISLVRRHLERLEEQSYQRAPQGSLYYKKEPRGTPGPQGQRFYWYAFRSLRGKRHRLYLGRAGDENDPPLQYQRTAEIWSEQLDISPKKT